MGTIKYLEYNNLYLEEINNFINESMHKFINRPYKIRQDVANMEEHYIKNGGNFWVAIDTNFNNGYEQIDKMEIDMHVGENDDSFKKVL